MGLTCVISGSLRRFLPAMASAADELQRTGVTVRSPRSFSLRGEENGFVLLDGDDEGSAEAIQARHLAELAASDFLYLVCPGGYVGVSASFEVGYAKALGIPVFASERPSDLILEAQVEQVVAAAKSARLLLSRRHSEIYDQLTGEYQERIETLRAVTEQALADLLPLLAPGSRLLDVGCGAGLVAETLAAAGHRPLALDLSPKMIDALLARLPQIESRCGDYLDMEFEEQFDAIVGFAFIHLFPADLVRQVLAKMHADLRSDGLLYIGTTITEESSEGWLEKVDYPGAPTRYRKQWQETEFSKAITDAEFAELLHKQHQDPYGKTWLDIIARRSERSNSD